ncbi:16S rRNA processing protein RimM [Methylocystis sp. L43]|uniref:ribosome maturation factor RimM n=1 Tax=unclassified Methylocystis TaxID=2625913 RepID=UPI0018C32471|nr:MULTISPECIES: ribosome maturation factor RimM [unclassified Methylocystis]MBG0799285.1 16S rRNA processing protein RimM [Methylocystis sp. L43]MBG0807067.1 16S rRNA processing protein RimM [Methylocystis sp. H15]
MKGPAKGLVLLGRFGAAHGVRGEIRLQSFTADPLAIAAYDGLTDKSGTRHFRLRAVRPQGKDMLVAQVEGVDDRAGAEALSRVEVYVARDKLPAPEEDEFYIADLIGLRAETADGQMVGVVVAVRNFGAGDILEIAPAQGPEKLSDFADEAPRSKVGVETLLLPFTKATTPLIDVKAGRVVIIPPTEVEGEAP